MKIWNDYQKVKPPKQVCFIADFGDYTDKCILDYNIRLWSETDKVFINDEPLKWRI